MTEVLSPQYPEIQTASHIGECIDITVANGSSLIRDVIAPYALLEVFAPDIELSGQLYGYGGKILSGRELDDTMGDPRVSLLNDIANELAKRSLPKLNSASLIPIEIGETGAIAPHADTAFSPQGIIVLFPIVHFGRVSSYPDGVFSTGEFAATDDGEIDFLPSHSPIRK
jgi:hypothetical protein